ncbi:MAG TPA: radical SAM family heme chaperone HemW [Gemmatimonadales bacterium]|jgi:oxygen-independent coproporphyrinogen-3 oxidase|nr:radical SAM family heme chaperone HemW [Gemmatimonadales bacterium]
MHLYLHIPFCTRRCSYCDFAIAVRRTVPSDIFAEAVLAEWEGWQKSPIWERSPEVSTIYLGGGTPSRLAPESLARILDRIRGDRPVAADAEVTLEANPEDVTEEAVKAWHQAGINRVSLGAQSFDPAVLEWMHRSHGPERIGQAVSTLRRAGFVNLSLDLIFGLPAELNRDWSRDLERAVALEPQHLSLYGLTVEPRTPVARWVERGQARPADEARYAAEFLEADQYLTTRGFEHYEVSNYARPGHRAIHNSAYWRRAPYLGLGPSAHSHFEGTRQWNLREWEAYQRAMAGGISPVEGKETLDPEARELERLYLGLRTSEGLPGATLPADLRASWAQSGWMLNTGSRVRLTPEGWLRMDSLVAAAAG